MTSLAFQSKISMRIRDQWIFSHEKNEKLDWGSGGQKSVGTERESKREAEKKESVM